MNIGERGEILAKLNLMNLRDQHGTFFDQQVYSVGFENEYGTNYRDLYEVSNYADEDLEAYAQSVGVTKAGVFDKADVFVNNVGFSLKSTNGARAALINHTTRPGYARVCNVLNLDIGILDGIVDRYWELRVNHGYPEDMKISDPMCPFRDYQWYFGQILQYFLFRGTGSRDSVNPAEYLIEFDDPLDLGTWRLFTPEDAVGVVWDHLVFSLRSEKGMPRDYDPSTYNKPDAWSIARWVRYFDGGYKGALHVRASTR